ncbi:hypothetical protein [Pleomorphomonas sp. NRK KF1]|uniref:hypothetical protein n=1 Tax=Pleomorphomonas sp. NRK KF1 TaxID=2943000 RepID=UPI0020446485|nr:hypothetical protein [Pleomorphomonas sp. NRK KF1]MCM5555781.1 hypothetical protein [Pleomorphomonas sp. NRK KF1]
MSRKVRIGRASLRRLLVRGATSGIAAHVVRAVTTHHDRTSGRFGAPADWRRLCALGAMLSGLAGLPVASFLVGGLTGDYLTDDYLTGLASIVGGLLQVLLILRIGSPDVYGDWVSLGMLDACLGMLLTFDPGLALWTSPALFALLLAASSLVRIWIGLTLATGSAFTWLGTSGLMGFFLLLWLVGATHALSGFDRLIALDLVLRVDLFLRGAAIVGFGLSLSRG